MLKKFLLITALSALAIGAFNHATAPQWDVGLPLGTIFLILFYIVTILEKEVALYDAEQHHQPESSAPSAEELHYLGTARSGAWH